MMSKPIFSWRHAVLESDLHATTKHVLLTLSCHMSAAGDSCFPTIKTTARECSLSKRTVITHIQKANESGWLLVGVHGFGGKKWRRHEYAVAIPEGGEPNDTEVVNLMHEGGEPNDTEVVNLMHEGGEPNDTEVVNLMHEGGEPNDIKVVKEVHSSTSDNSTLSTSCELPIGDTPAAAVPIKKIINLYHETCSQNPRVIKVTPARAQIIKSRWRNELTSLEDWERYFTAVSQSAFLTGRVPANGSRSKPFIADIDFLTKQGNVVKVMEGKYDD